MFQSDNAQQHIADVRISRDAENVRFLPCSAWFPDYFPVEFVRWIVVEWLDYDHTAITTFDKI